MKKERIDILNRDKFVDDVFTVIETLSANRKSCTFAINGEWGSGKSFVLDMLEERLSMWQNEETADNQYIVFHYNCWKYDYYEEPLVAIVSALFDEAKRQCDFFKPETTQKFKDAWTMTKSSVGYIAGGITNKLIGVNIRDMRREVKSDIEATHDNKDYDEKSTYQEAISEAKEMISKISNEQTVVIVVDELDRCLPEYSIKVLERLHHLFDDIENLIVVLAVDKERLNNTVSQIFGFDKDNNTIDINSYLAKFIDFEIALDKGKVDENYRIKYKEFLSRFKIDESFNIDVDLFVSNLLKPIEARGRDKLFEKALLIHDLAFKKEPVEAEFLLVELMWLVFKKESLNGEVNIDREYFLPREFVSRHNEFVEYYKNVIFSYITKQTISHPNYECIVAVHHGDNRTMFLYLLLHNPFFNQPDIAFQNEFADYQEKAERLKAFAKLLEVMN